MRAIDFSYMTIDLQRSLNIFQSSKKSCKSCVSPVLLVSDHIVFLAMNRGGSKGHIVDKRLVQRINEVRSLEYNIKCLLRRVRQIGSSAGDYHP